MSIRRICLYGGPGCGKSSVAADIFANLKKDRYNVELVTEYIKFWTFLDRRPQGFDQGYTMNKQIHYEDVRLRNGIDYIVSESPILLSAFYSKRHKVQGWEHLLGYSKVFENVYPGLHIFLDRTGVGYCPTGRWENLDQAIEIDHEMKDWLEEHAPGYVVLPTQDLGAINKHVRENLLG